MKRLWRVAVREYLENAKTKGFWIGILLFPVMILVFSQVPQFLEDKAVPTRNYIVIDRSDEFGEFVDAATEVRNRKREFDALVKHIQKHAPRSEEKIDWAKAIEMIDAMMQQMGETPDLSTPPTGLTSLTDVEDMIPDDAFATAEAFEGTKRALLSQVPNRFQLTDGRSFLGIVISEDDTAIQLRTADGIEVLSPSEVAERDGPPEFEPPRPRFRRVPLPEGIAATLPDTELEEAMRPYLSGKERIDVDGESGELFAMLIIPEDIATARRGLRYWSKTLTDTDLRDAARRSIAEEIRSREYELRGVSPAVVAEVQAINVVTTSLDPKKEVGEEQVSLTDTIRQWAPVAFVYLLWIAIFSTAQMLLNNTIEEKSNKIMEVLLSSVTPMELMGGKLFGVALLGLTMIGAWMGSLYAILKYKASPDAEFILGALQVVVTPELLIPFVGYFVLGYLLYAGIFASIGSICNTLKEAQNFMGPVMMILMVPLITMMFIPRDPNGTLATVLSWIPLYTPFVMMNRAAADPPMFDLVGTLVLLLVSCVLMLWASSKIFRVGILRTGQPPRLLELFRWIRGTA